MGKKVDDFGWVYGLVEIEREGQKRLELCEIYDMRGIKVKGEQSGNFASAAVDWKQFRQDKHLILKDLNGQAKFGFEFSVNSKTDRIILRIRKGNTKHKNEAKNKKRQ